MEIFRLLGRIAIDNDQANKAIEETAKKADGSSKKSSSAFEKIGGAAKKVGTSVIAAGTSIGGAFVAAVEGTREYRTEMGKLDTAFTTNGHSSAEAKRTYSELNSVLGDSAVSVEAANHLAVMTDNEKDLQTWTDICTGVFATFGDSLPIEGLTESANETAKVGQVTGPLADALNWAGISEDAFNAKLAKCSTEQERQKLIMDTLNGTYKNASKNYKENNKDIIEANKAQERLTDSFAALGKVGEPIMTDIKNAIADMVEKAVPKLEDLIKKVKDIKKWVEDNGDTINTWAGIVVGATTTVTVFTVALKWGKIMAAATKAVNTLRTAFILLDAAMAANPIGLVIGLIAGLVAAFIYLWNTSDKFRAFWIKVWDKIKSATGTAIKWVKGKFGDLNDALGVVKRVFGDISEAVSDKMDKAKSSVKSGIDKIKGFFDFDWSLPKIKVPHFSMKGKFDLKSLSVPKIGVTWNAAGGVFDEPTVLPSLAGWQGVGEAGKEAIAPIDVLKSYVRDAVREENESIGRIVIEQVQLLIDYLKRSMPRGVVLDTGAMVGELTPAIDARMADRWSQTKRGNTR